MAKKKTKKVASAKGPVAEVARLVKKYKPNRTLSPGRPLERGLERIAELDRFLCEHGGERAIADPALQVRLRAVCFKLEGWLRLYATEVGKSFEKARDKVKELEDSLGAVYMWREMRDVASAKKFPAAVIGHLDRSAATSMEALQELVADEWNPDPKKRDQVPALDELVGRLLDADLGSEERDHSFLRRRIAKHLEAIQKEKWDFSDLQGGIHELRREVRWLPLYLQALGGAVQLDASLNPVPKLAPLLKTADAKSAFIEMDRPTREANPIALSKSLIVANSRFINDLGAIKDTGEQLDFLAEAVEEAGVAKGAKAIAVAQKHLGKGHSEKEVEASAERAWKTFSDQGVLKALRTQLRG